MSDKSINIETAKNGYVVVYRAYEFAEQEKLVFPSFEELIEFVGTSFGVKGLLGDGSGVKCLKCGWTMDKHRCAEEPKEDPKPEKCLACKGIGVGKLVNTSFVAMAGGYMQCPRCLGRGYEPAELKEKEETFDFDDACPSIPPPLLATGVYPGWVCSPCAKAAGGVFPDGHLATFHYDHCHVCGHWRSVTEPRDFGYPIFTKKGR